jgi:hypothetical protein
MSQPRIQLNATILPNGKVLATGGSRNDEDALTASLNADLYDPISNTFSSAGANSFPRLYHSNALLMPDATVLLMGGNPQRGNYEARMEIYSPAYLFNTDGTPALRPTIASVPLDAIGYGATFAVSTPDATDISSVVLVRPGTPTHAFDMDQRLVGLSFTPGAGLLNVTAPPTGNIAPPGYYMLFVLNGAGVPSVARFVRIGGGLPNQPPVATITSPASNVTVNPGGSVSYAGTGSDPDGTISAYAWTFPGGTPSSSSLASPGAVTYSTPGTYAATFQVTDDKSLTSQPVSRTVTVSDFSLSATPASRTVLPGGATTYAATVGALNGFSGSVAFGVTGLPSGATATFTPPSVTGSGSTTMNVATTASTPQGSYPLTIQGTSGPLTRTAAVTLVVNGGDFSLSATPTSRTIIPGGTTTYTATVGALNGFTGTVALSVTGLPSGATGSFTPSSVTTSGSSTLNVATTAATPPGTYPLTIRGTSGPLTRTATVTLVVNGDFSISVTPTSRTISKGGIATYTVTVTAGTGFTGTVSFSVKNAPSRSTQVFKPTSVVNSGSSVLTVDTFSNVQRQTRTMTITASGGGRTHSVNVTLIVR